MLNFNSFPAGIYESQKCYVYRCVLDIFNFAVDFFNYKVRANIYIV